MGQGVNICLCVCSLRKEKRSFSTGHVQKPLDVSGALSLSSYQTVTGTHESKDALRHMGLSEEQIAIKLMADNEEKPQDTQVMVSSPVGTHFTKNFSIIVHPGCFSSTLFYHYLFSLLSSGLFVFAVI